MFHHELSKNREEVYVSPLALAVNIGDFGMLDSLLGYLKNVQVDEGMQARALNPPIHKNKNLRQLIKRTSPL